MAPSTSATPDSRLLNNLLKVEKDAAQSFKTWTKDAAAAANALSAWALADSNVGGAEGGAEEGGMMDISLRISQLLASCSDSQLAYLDTLSAYRLSLSDVLARESTIRTIQRDKDILINRLIKLSNKKPSSTSERERSTHYEKLSEAQRELAACERTLKEEQRALGGVKRRIFREALSMRMRGLDGLGETMKECAAKSLALLDQLRDDHAPMEEDATARIFPSLPIIPPKDVDAESISSLQPSNSASQQPVQPSPRQSISEGSSSSSEEGLPADLVVNADTAKIQPAPSAAKKEKKNRNAQLTVHVNPPRVQMADAEGSSTPTSKRGTIRARKTSTSSPRAVVGNGALPRSERLHDAAHPRLLRRQNSDHSSVRDTGSPSRKSFLGGLMGVFKRKEREEKEESAVDRRGHFKEAKWETRTDKHLKSFRKGARDESSSEEEEVKRLTVVKNRNPGWRGRDAMSDVGAPSSAAQIVGTTNGTAGGGRLKKKVKKASSDIGVSTNTPAQASTSLVPESLPSRKRKDSTPTVTPASRTRISSTTEPASLSRAPILGTLTPIAPPPPMPTKKSNLARMDSTSTNCSRMEDTTRRAFPQAVGSSSPPLDCPVKIRGT
ncbi:hypothetical protein BT69DRAFT_777865 [Atractiella rhizophila]|nr:hypothetical protein BT69DRAFT_777865 [Atractiella rhizophila]